MLSSMSYVPLLSFLAILSTVSPFASALRFIESKSLNPCQSSLSFNATLFNVIFTPNNGSLAFDIIGVSAIAGNVTADIEIIAYGINVFKRPLDPCTNNLRGMCPMNTGPIEIESNIIVPKDIVDKVPGIAYVVPDLDGLVRIRINETNTDRIVACVEADLSNGKTVNLQVIGWITAVIAGLALVASAVTSGLGHSNTAAHVAANALSLFGFFNLKQLLA